MIVNVLDHEEFMLTMNLCKIVRFALNIILHYLTYAYDKIFKNVSCFSFKALNI